MPDVNVRPWCATCGAPIQSTGKALPFWTHIDPAQDHPERELTTKLVTFTAEHADLLADVTLTLRLLLDKMARRDGSPYAPMVGEVESALDQIEGTASELTETEDEWSTADVRAHVDQFFELGKVPADADLTRTSWQEARAEEWDGLVTTIEVFLLPELEATLSGDRPLSIDLPEAS